MLRRISSALLCFILAVVLSGAGMNLRAEEPESYKFDIGAGIGMSGYLGDANESNIFHSPGFTGNLSFRWLAGNRFAVRGILTAASISGNTADFSNALPDGTSYSFKSSVYDLGARAEFNFFPYGIGETYKRLRRWTPYLALGLSVALASSDGHTAAAMSLPMAVGVKFKLRPRFNLAVEFAMTKVFGDHLDGAQLADLYTIKSSFLKNTDWFSTIGVSFSYEFGPRCVVCHRID